MNGFGALQAAYLIGCLLLAGSALAGHRLGWRRGFVMALIWFGIFLGIYLFIDLVRG